MSTWAQLNTHAIENNCFRDLQSAVVVEASIMRNALILSVIGIPLDGINNIPTLSPQMVANSGVYSSIKPTIGWARCYTHFG